MLSRAINGQANRHGKYRRKRTAADVLQSGSTTLTLDKNAGKATLRRKLLFWNLKPLELSLAEVAELSVDAGVTGRRVSRSAIPCW